EYIERNARAHNVHHRIHRTDFVEMHRFGRQAVNFSFGDRDSMEQSDGFLFYPIRQRALPNEFFYLREISPGFMGVPVEVMTVCGRRSVVIVVFDEMRLVLLSPTTAPELEDGAELVRLGQGHRGFQEVGAALKSEGLPHFARPD